MKILERLLGWFLDRFGMSFDDGQSTSPLCERCRHSFDDHEGYGLARPCGHEGCDCPNYIAAW